MAERLGAARRVLAVEDDADIAHFLRAYFRACGYDVVHLDPSTPSEVVDGLVEHEPDCVLLDYGLRGFSGTEVHALLRRDERFAFTPVIVVTADHGARDRAAGVGSGIDGFVTKPFNANTLRDIVDERIAAARAIAEVGREERYGLFTDAYLTARITDEINIASGDRPLAFALVHIGRIDTELGPVDDEAVIVVRRRLIDHARERLPHDALLGRTEDGELAILVPGLPPQDLLPVVDVVLDELRSTVTLPGGATVRVEAMAGVAGYPDHASDPDGLYMAADAAMAEAADTGRRVSLAL